MIPAMTIELTTEDLEDILECVGHRIGARNLGITCPSRERLVAINERLNALLAAPPTKTLREEVSEIVVGLDEDLEVIKISRSRCSSSIEIHRIDARRDAHRSFRHVLQSALDRTK
jgi:hypothetical protein